MSMILHSLNTDASDPKFLRGRLAPKAPKTERPEHQRAITIEAGLRGHVVSSNLVQSDTGRRYRAAVGHLSAGAAVGFDVVADPAPGSRLHVASNIVALVTE
jgi:hypothetical protein